MAENKKQELNGIERASYYKSGALKSCMLGQKNEIITCVETLVPRFGPENERTRYTPAVTFFESGAIKSLALEKQALIQTPVGNYPAELVTFYESGELKRFFPLNGKISGFWSEEDEKNLSEKLHFKLSCGLFYARVIGLCFYRSGKLKSLTLWPKEEVILNTNCGLLPVRGGFSLYESGNVQSVEPAYPLLIASPVGNIRIYDETACGVNADLNSLRFDEEGNIVFFKTSLAKIAVYPAGKSQIVIGPATVPSPLDPEELMKLPMTVSLLKNKVTIDTSAEQYEFDLNQTAFTPLNDTGGGSFESSCGGNCDNCSLCG